MRTVQEIEAALGKLTLDELNTLEHLIRELKAHRPIEDTFAYAMREYGVSREELQGFEERMAAKLAEAQPPDPAPPSSGITESRQKPNSTG